MPDFESMSIEEIESWREERRVKMREIKAEIDSSKETLTTKIALKNLGAQLRIDTDGLTAEDAIALRRVAQMGIPRTGDVVAEPETFKTETRGLEGEAKNE